MILASLKVAFCQFKAELSGIDVDHRCADICAINLGLRSRYGWVICGNSLSRNVQYVYRIGSFYHESPNGLRRGVFRKVPNEFCPILPELQSETRQDLLSTLEQEDQSIPTEQTSLPNIIEVPRWLLHLEYHQLQERMNNDSIAEGNLQEEQKPTSSANAIKTPESKVKTTEQANAASTTAAAEINSDAEKEIQQNESTTPRQKKLF